MFDVDVVVLSALRLADQGVGAQAIGLAILAALCTNGVGRLALGTISGPVAFWLPLMAATLTAAGVGAIVYAVAPLG